MMQLKKTSIVVVGNIPGEFHSTDLRYFFSSFIEKGGFLCFHYRHRPERFHFTNKAQGQGKVDQSETRDEVASSSERSSSNDPGVLHASKSKNCCVVSVKKELEREFLRRYRGKQWSGRGGELHSGRVRVSRLHLNWEVVSSPALLEGSADSSYEGEGSGINLIQTDAGPALGDTGNVGGIPWSDLKTLPELNPPSVMPRGNVGTPISEFMRLIKSCKLPATVIKKLQLEFPRARPKRRYGTVGLDYGTGEPRDQSGGKAHVEEREEKGRGTSSAKGKPLREGQQGDENEEDCSSAEEAEEKEETIATDDDFDAEEWERYEALHDDVDNQERTKERLFEEEMEVVWDKGSSGLVFYTDASHWDQLDGDFDEKCSKEDDWDVDMAGYYDYESADRDAMDLRDMAVERRCRDGVDTDRGFWKIGDFEKFTKGIGSKLLRKEGWTEGSGVGVSSRGLAEPLEAEGQDPKNKRGFGYRGEKLANLSSKRPRTSLRLMTKDVLISTVYDQPREEEDTPLRRAPTRSIKYRHEPFKFVSGGVLHKPTSK